MLKVSSKCSPHCKKGCDDLHAGTLSVLIENLVKNHH